MKHFMIVLVLMVLPLSAPVSGQPVVTVKFGVSHTHIISRDYLNKSMRIGASVAIPTHNRYGLQFGTDYTLKGEPGLEIAYIEFSGLGTVSIVSLDDKLSLSLLAGPAVAIKVWDDDIIDDSIKLKAIDLGIAGGIGMQITPSEKIVIGAELLYTRGIRSISENPHLKNRALSFSVGFGFPL